MPTDERVIGTVRKVTDKGYGFVGQEGEGGKRQAFFHARDLENVAFHDLKEGDRLEYVVEEGEKGLKARDIVLLSE
jgi:CspA family cold shock protein